MDSDDERGYKRRDKFYSERRRYEGREREEQGRMDWHHRPGQVLELKTVSRPHFCLRKFFILFLGPLKFVSTHLKKIYCVIKFTWYQIVIKHKGFSNIVFKKAFHSSNLPFSQSAETIRSLKVF